MTSTRNGIAWHVTKCLFALLLPPLTGDSVYAENWPSFRGPLGTGVSADTSYPVRWSDEEHVRWRSALPDRGNATPVVWGDRVFVSQAIESKHRRTVMCFASSDGTLLWQSGIRWEEREPTNSQNPYCSASPATDGKRVVAFFGSPGLYCYDYTGKEIWHRDLGDLDSWHGAGSSPIIHEGLCFLNFGPGTAAAMVACDMDSGEVVWRVTPPTIRSGLFDFGGLLFRRRSGAAADEEKPNNFDTASMGADTSGRGGYRGSWSTPTIVRVGDRNELIVVHASQVVAYEPTTGRQLWRCSGVPSQVFTSPAIGDGVLVASGHVTPTGTKLLAIKLGGHGDVTGTHRLWEKQLPKDHVGSGVVADGYFYSVAQNGIAICLDLSSGEKKWEKRLRGKGRNGGSWSSIVLADGKLLLANHSGEVFLVKAAPEFQLLGVNTVLDETHCASPAISGGLVFLRTYESLWCLGQ